VKTEVAMGVNSQVDLMRRFVRCKLEVWPEFVAALIVGSVAHGEARPDSDVDCVLVFDKLDEAIVPAEFVWVPATDAYHTIFEVEASDVGGIQIDAKRVALDDLRRQEWPEGFKHELAHALVLYDRHQSLAELLKKRVAYPESVRLSRIRDHVGWAEYYLAEWRLLGWIDRGGIEGAHDQLTAAFEELIQLLHAYNREWLPWRYRWMVSAQRLSWLPDNYPQRAAEITSRVSANKESVLKRRSEISSVLDDTLDRLQSEGLLAGPDEAFIAAHPGLGYAHTFDAWRGAHQKLLRTRGMPGNQA
jgi:predicted nucleotidyltransferase